jgi:hypothetical protein
MGQLDLEELYRRKYQLYQTENAIDRLVSGGKSVDGKSVEKEDKRDSNDWYYPTPMCLPTDQTGIKCSTFEVYPEGPYIPQKYYGLIYFFDENSVKPVRYPIVTLSVDEFNTILAKFMPSIPIPGPIKPDKEIPLDGGEKMLIYNDPFDGFVISTIVDQLANIISVTIRYFFGPTIEVGSNNIATISDCRGKCKGGYGYKLAKTKDEHDCLITLYIPSDALIAMGLDYGKARANTVQVINIVLLLIEGRKITMGDEVDEAFPCLHSGSDLVYRKSETIHITDFDSDLTKVCVPGVHFFWSRLDLFRCFFRHVEHPTWAYGDRYYLHSDEVLLSIKTWLLVQKRLIPQMPAEIAHYIVEFIVAEFETCNW